MRNFKRIIALILCIVLVAAVALFANGCKKRDVEFPDTTGTCVSGIDKADGEGDEKTEDEEATVVGEGETQFTFRVVDKDGKETVFTVNTDKKTVGEALQELQLIEGEEGDYGLYVKKVNGILADYDVDQTYWAFYVNGEYAMSGADVTDIEDGAEYSFKIEK